MRTIFHLACADFLERTRRYGFLVVLGLVVFLGYQVASDSLGLHLGGYRGEYNSAWVGSMMALIASIFLGWFGFYVVNSSVARDRETGVGQIMAATPMSRLLYVAGKWTSNFFVLVAMVIILALAGIAIQLFQGEYLRLDLIAFLRPFILLTLPMIALVAGLAVLFECIRFLSGGFGNIVYFFMFIFFIAAIELPGVDAALEPTGVAVINEGMSAEVLQRYPDYDGQFTIGWSGQDVAGTFLWNGIHWTPARILMRAGLVGLALLIAGTAALFLDRFDPARTKPRRGRPGWFRAKKALPDGAAAEPQSEVSVQLASLGESGRRFTFTSVLFAEVKLLLKGRRWWWYLIFGGLIVAGFVNSAVTARGVILPMAWIWPLLVWSPLGNREAYHSVGEIVFSAPFHVWRQLPAQWLSGFLVALAAGSGVLMQLGFAGDLEGIAALLAGAAFIPSLALACGVWSEGSKLFEVLYVSIWYLGPLNRLDAFDFIGASSGGSPGRFLILSVILFAVAAAGRLWQARR